MSSSNNNNNSTRVKPRRSASFLSKLRPAGQLKTSGSDIQPKPPEQPKTTSRRESLGNFQQFLKTLTYWKRSSNSNNTTNNNNNNNDETTKPSSSATRPTTSTNTQNHQSSTKVERSKSFSVKCDKGYSTYYQIEIVKKAPPSTTTLEQHQEHNNKPVIENNNYQKLGGFHEVGLPLGPTYKRPLRRSASTLSHFQMQNGGHCHGSGRFNVVDRGLQSPAKNILTTRNIMGGSSTISNGGGSTRCDIIRLGAISENNGGSSGLNVVTRGGPGGIMGLVRNPRHELEEYARQYEPLYYSRPQQQQQHRMPVKKLVCAYNEQILRKQHNSAYAKLCNFTRQPVIYVNIYPYCSTNQNDSLSEQNSKQLNRMIVTSEFDMEPPPRPPKQPHLQNRQLSPSSVDRIRKQQTQNPVKFKPPAPDPEPEPPDLRVTQSWIKQHSDIKNQFLRSLETSDSSGCSSLTSRSPTSATTSPLSSLHSGRSDIDATTSPISGSGYGTSLVNATQPPITTKVINTPPDLLLWNRNPSLLIHNNSSQSLQKSQTETLIAETEQKLTDLNAQKLNVEELIRQNEALGQGITCLVETRATAKEYSKFQLHIEDIDKITSLLVSLSGRLARVESSINDLEQDEDDSNGQKASLLSKKEKLQGQLMEAKTLQENIDRRSKVVQNILQKYLSMYELQDYENFVGKKSKFIMETREISDRIALCEEQMRNLTKKQNL